MPDDATLLRRYARDHSEEAFAELVRRHLDLVYSAALRHVRGDVHRAQDITQTVFTDLARKAALLSNRSMIAGWLYLSTHHAAAQLMRTEQRRQAREQEAHLMNENAGRPAPEIDWEQLHPVLDETIRNLSQPDREAVLLRFFEQRPFAEIGAVLRLNEDSARKRVDRALEKLRAGLASRGVTSSTASLSLVIANQAIVAAPAALATKVCVSAHSTATVSTGLLSSVKVLLLTHLNASLLSAVLLAGAATIAAQHFARASISAEFPPPTTATPSSPVVAKPPRPINPAWHGLIVIGLTSDEAQSARLQKQADEMSLALQARGLGAAAIQRIAPNSGTRVTRETVLSALRAVPASAEEVWLVLLGQAAPDRNGRIAFQVSGPRLSADDFAAAVGALPGKKYVIAGTALSGGFLPPLEALPQVEAVSATDVTGELNEPRFAQSWAEALMANPDASFAALTSDAAARVAQFYRQKGIAQGEHARLIDRVAKTIIDVPAPSPVPPVGGALRPDSPRVHP